MKIDQPVTPPEVPQEEQPDTASSNPENAGVLEMPKKHDGFTQKILANPKARVTIVCIASLVMVAAIASIVVAYRNQTGKSTGCEGDSCNDLIIGNEQPTPEPTPALFPRTLDGVLVPSGEEAVRPLAIIVQNHPDARPHSGLARANVVYEAIAEGGITRFLALYTNPEQGDVRVGPVRSVRTYYLDFAREYNAFLAHVGGNMDALDDIKANGGITDLDQFALGGAAYWRDPSRRVATEHTMYTSTKRLWDYVISRNFDRNASFEPLPFKDDAPEAERPAEHAVRVNFSTITYQADWTYGPTTNSYARSLAGRPHVDAETNERITAKNIVIQTVQRTPTVTRINEAGWRYTLTGSGKVVVIRDGKAISGSWKREGNQRTRYFDEEGKEISLVRGTTWVQVIHPDLSATY
jgi:hypothetical protein